ncbi:heme-dependent oxidative N-demethylase family protein [Cochlodiniinecator piscidefendens]|uniref:heme-dependent oxidative N-demethylase family protein n=1 Tax=Cochlodiniinecator piscidefendens TaxID=2715756 RepID=UPI002F4211CF
MICQSKLTFAPWLEPRARKLPGLMPIEAGRWLIVDDAYTGQLKRKRSLLQTSLSDVLMVSDGAQPAAHELLEAVLEELKGQPGFHFDNQEITRPDGERVIVDWESPMMTLSQLVQEDFAIMEKQGDEHVLTAALLCFPASWTLRQKYMRPLLAIHATVDVYDDNIGKRVQRLFDGIQVDRPMWRANALFYTDPELYQPRLENDPRPRPTGPAAFVRSERQSMIRLPQSNAVVFSIHTSVVRRENLTEEQADGLSDNPIAVA